MYSIKFPHYFFHSFPKFLCGIIKFDFLIMMVRVKNNFVTYCGYSVGRRHNRFSGT